MRIQRRGEQATEPASEASHRPGKIARKVIAAWVDLLAGRIAVLGITVSPRCGRTLLHSFATSASSAESRLPKRVSNLLFVVSLLGLRFARSAR